VHAQTHNYGLLAHNWYFADVTVTIKSRIVTVKGPRGTITKPFNHKAIEIKITNEATKNRQGKHIRLRMWNASYREAASVTTFKSLISNMLIGVTEVSIDLTILCTIRP
jgi:large subunit ribosomal protein L9e